MLVFRVLATIFVGISCLTSLFKNLCLFKDIAKSDKEMLSLILYFTLLGWLWRAFVILSLWRI